MKTGRRSLVAFLAGSLMPLGFSPFDWYPLVLLSLAVLFALWRHATPAQGFVLGGLFGLGMFLFGVSWVFISMYDFGHVSMHLSLFLTLLFASVLALFPALAGWLSVRLQCRDADYRDLAMLLIFPAVWVLIEWTRGWFMTGFPWLLAGYSQLDSPLAGYAPLFGVYGVSLIVALSAAMLVLTVSAGRIRGVYVFALVSVWLVGAILGRIAWTTPDQDTIRVTLIQGNIPQDLKWYPSMREPTLELYRQQTETHWDSDLVIWPETALPLFSDSAEAGPYLDSLAEEARAEHSAVLLGLVYRDPDTGKYYNSMLGLGKQRSLYHKHHLVPFTEYLPLKNLFGGIVGFLDVPISDFSAGDSHQRPLPLAGQRIGMTICYEDAFGEEVINQLPEATLLVNVSNDAWFSGSVAPAQHLQMSRMRALESGRVLLRATNTGISAVIDQTGRIVKIAPQDKLAALDATVRPRSGATLYVVTGNALVLCACAIMLLAGRILSRKA